MSAHPLSHSSDAVPAIIDAFGIMPLTHAEAGSMARAILDRFLRLIESLHPADWSRSTMCAEWSVRDIVAHQAGAYQSATSFAVFLRQWNRRPQPGRELLDVVNAYQISERSGRTPAELIAELRDVGPRGIASRQQLSALLRALPIPIPSLGLRPLGYLTDELYARDTWIHSLDISKATGFPLKLTAELDGRFVALIIRDLALRIARELGGATVVFDLTGPAGGRFRIGPAAAPLATITLDAVDFNLLASGRITAEIAGARAAIDGDASCAALALERTMVVY